MNPFGRYAQYYDLIYADKDYIREIDYIVSLVKKYRPDTKSVLDLGCGTGRHATILASNGYTVHGIDYSADMIAEANQRAQSLSPDTMNQLCFAQADICEARIGKKFDAVISLFHVISYICSNDDLHKAFATVREHLHADGLFIFDCWYGPAVLTDRPVARTKYFKTKNCKIKRDATPALFPNDDLVEISYVFSVTDDSDRLLDQFHETHRMRYFFRPETEILLSAVGLELLECRKWLTTEDPGFDSWYVIFIAKAK